MTVLSVAQACRRLGIDAKTLHRWLAHAQLPLSSHASDGRKKGVSSEHLHLLARLHQRQLAPLAEEPSPAEVGALPPLPAALLTLPETLAAVQAQLVTLQQQVAVLTQLLQQHAQPSACPPAEQAKAAQRPAKPAPPALRARRATQPPPKPRHVLPLVEAASEGQYVVICPTHGRLLFAPESAAWFAWLATQSSFRFVGKLGRFTAHREVERVRNGAWRAHRKIRNHTDNLPLGSTQSLTIAVLEQAAATFQAHLK